MIEIFQYELQVSPLSKHPEVGGKSEVGGDDVENPAPDAITEPNITVVQNKEVPKNPRNAIHYVGDEEILMNGDSVTGETFEAIEDHEGAREKEQGETKAKQC